MVNRGHALSRDELIRTLTAYNGITTADGAADGTTLIDSALIDNPYISPSGIPGKTVLILSGDARGEDKGAASFNNGNGAVTLQGTGFSAQIRAGTIYRILNISSVESLIAGLISFSGTTTSNGGAGGSSLICSDLAAEADFDGNQVVITTGDYRGQARDINGITTGGTVTPHLNFGGVIVEGTEFIITAIRVVPAELAVLTALVVALMADVGDASASTLGSILAILGDPATSFATQIATAIYGDRVFFDDATGIAGTAYPVGTPQVPSDVIADVITMCAARNLYKIEVHGALTLGAAMQHYCFFGAAHEDIADILDLSDEDVDGSHIEGLIVTGGQGGAAFLTLVRCVINAVTTFNGRMEMCDFWGGVTSSFKDVGYIDLIDCTSIYGAVTITVQAPTRASIKNWNGNLVLTLQDGGACFVRGFKGTLEIDAMTAGTLDIYANGADITINADCIGTGTINIHGNARVTDNHGAGTTVNDYTIDTLIGTPADNAALGTLFARHLRQYLGTHTHALVVVHDTSALDADLDTALQQWLLDEGFVVTLADPADVAGELEAGSFDLVVVSASCVAGDVGNLANLNRVGAPVICHSADIAASVVFDLGATPHTHAAQTEIEITDNTVMYLITQALGDLVVTASANIYAMNTITAASVELAQVDSHVDDHITALRLSAGEENEAGYAAFYDRYFVGVGDYTNMNAVWKAVMAELVMHCVMEKRFTEEAVVQVKGVYQEDIPDTGFSLAAVDPTLTNPPPAADAANSVVDIDQKNNRTYVLRSLWVNVTNLGGGTATMTFKLWVDIGGTPTEVDSVDVTVTGYRNLMDIFGLPEVHADSIYITAQVNAGTGACAGIYRYAEAKK